MTTIIKLSSNETFVCDEIVVNDAGEIVAAQPVPGYRRVDDKTILTELHSNPNSSALCLTDNGLTPLCTSRKQAGN